MAWNCGIKESDCVDENLRLKDLGVVSNSKEPSRLWKLKSSRLTQYSDKKTQGRNSWNDSDRGHKWWSCSQWNSRETCNHLLAFIFCRFLNRSGLHSAKQFKKSKNSSNTRRKIFCYAVLMISCTILQKSTLLWFLHVAWSQSNLNTNLK